MLLRWQANGQLKLEFAERLLQYSQNTSHLYVLTDVFSSSEGQMFCQFGKWDASTAQYISLSDENGTPKIFSMGWKLQEKFDGSAPSWLYDCYIPAELLTHSGAVCVTLTYQLNGEGGNHDKHTALFTTGNFGFNIERNLPTGQIIPSDSELASLIDKVNELELNAMTATNTNVFNQTLPAGSQATVSITSTTDSSGQKHFTFNFGMPQGLKGDSGINSAYLSNDDGDSEENGYTQWKVNRLLESMLSNDDGDSTTKGYTQSAANRIVNSKIVNAAGNSETKAYSQAAANNTFSNPNLLINPDFRINQRGKEIYTGAVYSWDRWKAQVQPTTVNTTTGIISCSTGNRFLEQRIEDYENLRGKTLTVSFAYENLVISGISFYLQVHDGVNWLNSSSVTTENGLIKFTFTVAENATRLSLYLVRETNTEISVKPLWAKLEVGTIATPFVPPQTADELLKCQRYFYKLQQNGTQLLLGTGSFATANKKECRVPFTFPTIMRQPPTITYQVQRTGGGDAVARINYAVLDYSGTEIYTYGGLFLFVAQFYEATVGQACDVFITQIISCNISFDAEIY